MLDNTIDNAVKELVREVKTSRVYQEYEMQLTKIKKHPKLYEKVNEFRVKNFELQTQESSEDLYEKMDSFEQEYENIIENPMVSDFLRAELAFCRMIQEVNIYIAQELDFEGVTKE